MMFFKYKRKFNILNPEYASARERDNYSIFNNKEVFTFLNISIIVTAALV